MIESQSKEAVPVRAPETPKVCLVAAAFCCAVGVLVLFGWAWGLPALTQLLPGLTAMNPMTAVALSAAGVALAVYHRVSQRTLWAISAIILTIGLAKIFQVAGLSLFAIDRVLFTANLGDALGVPTNRMAPNTALSLVIAALAIATSKSSSRRSVLISQALCCLMLAITLFALIGYTLGIVALYGVKAFNPMAVHTACALMMIAAGVLSANPGVGLMRVLSDHGPAGKLSRLVLPLVVLVPVAVGLLRLRGQKLGYYDTNTGVALQVFANVLVTFGLMMFSIILLYRSDLARRGRELNVRRSEEEFRIAERLGRVGHWRVDLSTNEIRCSQELKRICGLTDDARPSRRSILALHHPDDAARQRICSDAAISEGTGWDEKRRIIRANGDIRTIRSHGTVEKDERGKTISLFGVFVDVTELEQARLRAEAATAAKADFLANMSHEIRTPLNAIIGFTDLILDDDAISDVHRRQLRLVKNSGGALLTVVNDILDFSKMEAGKVELSPRAFDLSHLAQSTVSIVRQSAEAKGLILRVQNSADSGQYYIGDDSRIRQILLNLLSNAVKFTQEGSVSLAIDCASGPEVDTVTFTVVDSGVGIAEKDEHRLFEQFSQANSSISREHGGTGLGLAISKRLVTSMAGSIGFKTAPTGGSAFWFSIPLRISNEVDVESSSAPRLGGGAQRILVVEDVAANQELLIAMLERGGHEVTIASDGREALSTVQKQEFDLILMDVQMPIMDGVTATRLIRLLPGSARVVPIIALTANILPEQIEAFRTAGMDDHVGKPINVVELTDAIARHTVGVRTSNTAETKELVVQASFNDKTFNDLRDMLPTDRLVVHLQTFQIALTQLAIFTGDIDELRSMAHSLISQAGMFGFVRLSALCRDLENEAGNEWPTLEVLSLVRSEIELSVAKLNELQGEFNRLSA